MLFKRVNEKRQLKGIIMDRRLLWMVLGGLFIGLMLTTILARGDHGEVREKIQWEYKVIVISGPMVGNRDKIETKLNGLGKDGWELIDFEESSYVLKRPAFN
jgi:hypothetical protein